jgi:hypothetical protein
MIEDDGLNLIVSEPARVLYVLGPKCGSTGTVNLFLRLSGLDVPHGMDRNHANRAMRDGRLAAVGMQYYRCGHRLIREMRAKYPGFTLLTNIRDPYGRALSNWFSKINRYARAFAPPVYRYGKLRQLLSGPAKWDSSRHGNVFMQRRISFEDMLRGLAEHGPGFDPHFDLQWNVLDFARLRYDRILRLETLDERLIPTLAELGMPAAMLARVEGLKHANASDYRQPKDSYFTPEARRLIEQVYARDFAELDYPLIG